ANAPMSAMAIDVAQGGADQTALVWRYDAWFDKPVVKPGSETPTGSEAAALVIQHRRNGATIVVDEGGGFGGATIQRLKDNFINPVGFNGAKGTNKRSQDRRLTFANCRAASWWAFREALCPDQPGGSPICLPDDPVVRADLCAPRWRLGPH